MLYNVLNIVNVILYFFLNAIVCIIISINVILIANNEITMFDVGF